MSVLVRQQIHLRNPAFNKPLLISEVGYRSVDGAAIEPGASATYHVDVTWPDHGGDMNVYQGASLTFTVTAAAQQVAA